VTDPIAKALAGSALTADEAEAAFDRFMDGSATPEQMAALLLELRRRGARPSEVAGGVRALAKAMVPVDLGVDGAIDTCGTGGGSLTTFNISTAAAIVAVSAGARIAKHGNRSFTSRCGSADVLEILGVPIRLDPDPARRFFQAHGFVFMFAPAHHPAMRHVAPVRRELGVTTIMNLLGPLANPARVRRQLVGVAHPDLLDLVAASLRELGHERALVVHGAPGMDELSPLGPSRVLVLEGGEIEERTVHPSDFGWPGFVTREIEGGEPAENAAKVDHVVRGEEGGAARAAVVLNAGAALWVAGVAADLTEGVRLAEAAIDEGRASAKLDRLAGG